jgi:hypothetical protein
LDDEKEVRLRIGEHDSVLSGCGVAKFDELGLGGIGFVKDWTQHSNTNEEEKRYGVRFALSGMKAGSSEGGVPAT